MTQHKTLVVTIPGMIDDGDLAPLRRLSDVDYRERTHIDESGLAKLCQGYDYLMLNYDVVKKLTEDFYVSPGVRALKAISADITGMDWASPQAARQHGLMLLNTPRYSTESVAESILCEVLLHSRQRHAAYKDEIKGHEPEARKGINLLGTTAGVVGLGSIGTRVAGLLEAVGMKVVAWNRAPRDGFEAVSLERLFDISKVICLCVKTVTSGSEATVGLVERNLLSRCKQAIIVNLASAPLVDHEAILDSLQFGAVSGYSVERSAALMSLPQFERLAQLDSVHMPPSNAWFSEESLRALRQIWVDNIVSAISGNIRNVYTE
jgi:phosphoglycerate dehydrogenase-like enzyme